MIDLLSSLMVKRMRMLLEINREVHLAGLTYLVVSPFSNDILHIVPAGE